MNINFLGNFSVDYCSEVHHAKSLEQLGHRVFRFQEGKANTRQILQTHCDLFIWVHTHGWRTPGLAMKQVLSQYKHRDIPTLTYHLDLWKGLKREVDMRRDDYWNIGHFFTVDKLMADWLNANTQTKGHYIQAGVFQDDCYISHLYNTGFDKDVIFVGSRGYHSEWPYRVELLDWLGGNYPTFELWGGDGKGVVREAALNNLYAKTKIVIGDTLCINYDYPYYWSDRVYETLGRGGFIIHPYIKGMEEHFEDKKHLVFYQYANFGQLKELIDYYLTHDEEREAIRIAGHSHVKENHTYKHRWTQILSEL